MPPLNAHHQEFVPPEELQDAIKCFWYDKINFGKKLSDFEVVPDGYAEIIFHFGSGCSILHEGKLTSLPSPFMIGLLNQPVHFYAKGSFEIICVRCFPWTVFDLLGLPSGKSGLITVKHPIAHLHSILDEFIKAGRKEEAILHLQKYFLESRSKVASDKTLSKAGIAMRKAKGTLPVNQVAAAAHATVRTLERKFKQSSGFTVKDVSALMRFEQVRNRLLNDPKVNLAGLAQELGYTDQSHLSREFKRYSGTSPSAFARNTKKEKKISGGNFVAFVQA